MTLTEVNSHWPPFLKWGNYKSNDENNLDVLELKVIETEPFETEYSVNVNAMLKDGSEWTDIILPLNSHNSNNRSLLAQWRRYTENGLLKLGKKLRLKTWLGVSKRTGRVIRRFAFEF